MLSVRLLSAAFAFPLVFALGNSSLRAAPTVSSQIVDQTVYDATPANEIDLNTKFSDPTLSPNTVRLTTILGDIDVTLYDQQTPITVDNFLHYIDSGAYTPIDPNFGTTAPIFFHRAIKGFVIQSGGYVSTKDPTHPPDVLPGPVTTFSPIPNESRPDLHNVRGTIAMAKPSDSPDGATSQWFINLGDNSGTPYNLDTEDGGFTVFGTISADGLTTADAIAALPNYNASFLFGPAFITLPLQNLTTDVPRFENLALISAIARPLRFSATSDHPAIATASVIANDLFVQGVSAGNATVTVTATDANGATASQSFGVTVTATPVRAANISTRLQIGAADDSLIGGFIVRGSLPKRVLLRAIGPSLSTAGVTGTLSNPTLELHDGTGALLASDDNWAYAPNKRDIIDTGLAPSNPNESAILTTLEATTDGSAYTAVMRNVDGTSGIGLVEVYDLDSGPGSSLLNISTRGNVQAGDNVMIGGFIVAGNGSQQVLVRAIGPSLGAVGITDPLVNPTLTLYNSQGSQIDFNDDWQDSPDEAAIEATGIAPNDSKESAVLQTLAPGAYTAIVQGAGGGSGTGLVEVYVLSFSP